MKLILKPLFLINLIAIAVYFYVFFNLRFPLNEELMFETPDSQTYLSVSKWINGGEVVDEILTRPFLYPLIISIFSKIGGVFGIWFFQFLCWLLTVNFIFLSLKEITSNLIYSYIGSAVVMLNFSLIALTFHGLTEVFSTFLLSVLVYLVVTKGKKFNNVSFIHSLIAVLTVLTVIKPVFYIPLLICLLVAVVFYYKKYFQKPFRIIYLLLLLSPLLIQFSIMKSVSGKITVSEISGRTFTNYLFAKGLQEGENITRDESLLVANSLSNTSKINYLAENKKLYTSIFFNNLKNNIIADPTHLIYPLKYENFKFIKPMTLMNKGYYYIHLVFFLIDFILLFILLKRKLYSVALILFIVYSLNTYYILVTGISFWQGDRLVLPSIALWSVLYLYSFFLLREFYFKYKIKSIHESE